MHDTKGQPYVYVVKGDSSVEQRSITTGEMVKGDWLVNSGLKSGEQVIVNGLQNVRSGSKVKAVAATTQDTPDAGSVSLSMTDPSAQ